MNQPLLPALRQELLKQHFISVHDEWIEDCLETLSKTTARNVRNQPLPQVVAAVMREFLATNLNHIGIGRLPSNIYTWHSKALKVKDTHRQNRSVL